MEWISLLQTVGGILAGAGGYGLFNLVTRNGRNRDKADADRKVAEAQQQMIANYEERIKDLHDNIQRLNAAEKEYISRISEQNHAITGKVEQIRNLTQKSWESEQEVNRVQNLMNDANGRIIRLTEERDEERRLKEFYRMWRCEKSVCNDPEGRRPPNTLLAGLVYIHPE